MSDWRLDVLNEDVDIVRQWLQRLRNKVTLTAYESEKHLDATKALARLENEQIKKESELTEIKEEFRNSPANPDWWVSW